MTVNELYDSYIDAKQHDVRITSLNKTKQILSLNVLPIIGSLKLDKLNNQSLQKWKNEINEKDLSITTKKNIYAELRTMLNYAVRMDYLPRNPLEKVGNFATTESRASLTTCQFETTIPHSPTSATSVPVP